MFTGSSTDLGTCLSRIVFRHRAVITVVKKSEALVKIDNKMKKNRADNDQDKSFL